MFGASSATNTADALAEQTPFVPAEEKADAAEADIENNPTRRLSFTAALTPRSRATVHQERARTNLIRRCALAVPALLLLLGLSRAAMT